MNRTVNESTGRITVAQPAETLTASVPGAMSARIADPNKPLATAPKPASLAKLRIFTAAELRESASSEVSWIWTDYIARGCVTLFHGRPKAGKSTLTYGLVGNVLRGESFLGRATTRVPVLYAAEDHSPRILEAIEDFPEGAAGLHLAPWQEQKPRPNLRELLAGLGEATKETGAGLVVIDTLTRWGGLRGEEENQAAAAHALMDAIEAFAAEANVGCLLIHHTKKSAGPDPIESARGSSAIVGAAAHVMYLRKDDQAADSTRRTLAALGRFGSCPAEVISELSDHGQHILVRDGLPARRTHRAVLEALPTQPPGMTVAMLRAALPRTGRSHVYAGLAALHGEGLIARVGTGSSRHDPYRYWNPGCDALLLRPDVPESPFVAAPEHSGGPAREDLFGEPNAVEAFDELCPATVSRTNEEDDF